MESPWSTPLGRIASVRLGVELLGNGSELVISMTTIRHQVGTPSLGRATPVGSQKKSLLLLLVTAGWVSCGCGGRDSRSSSTSSSSRSSAASMGSRRSGCSRRRSSVSGAVSAGRRRRDATWAAASSAVPSTRKPHVAAAAVYTTAWVGVRGRSAWRRSLSRSGRRW